MAAGGFGDQARAEAPMPVGAGKGEATPPPSTISQDGCPLPPSPISALHPLGRSLPGEVTLLLFVRISQKMKNSSRSVLPRSFGPVPICHYCTQASFLLS